MQAFAVAERVVAADWNQHVHADLLEVPQNVPGDVVDRLLVAAQMRRYARARQVAWTGSRCVKERPAGAAGAIHDRLRQLLHILGIVDPLVAVVVDESCPPAADTYDAVSLAQRPDCDRSYRRIETGDVTAPGKDRDSSLIACHSR